MTPVILSPFANHILKSLIFLFIPLSIMAPHGVVWEIIIAGLIGLYYSRTHTLEKLPKPMVVVLFMIPLWGLLSSLWSKYSIHSLTSSLKIFALVFLGIFWCRLTLSLPPNIKKYLMQALLVGLLTGIVFLLIEEWLGSPWRYFWNKTSAKAFAQGSLMISLVAWPVILWILQRPYSFSWRLSMLVSLLAVVFLTLLQIECDTSYIGLLLGICVFLGTLYLPRLTSWGMRLFVPLIIISFPIISLYAFKPEYIPTYNKYIHSASYIDRMYIWNDVTNSIVEHPWLGIGMDGSRSHEKTQLIREWKYTNENGKVIKNQTACFPIHPHNAILQLWLELGFLGVIMGTLLAYLALFYIYKTNLSPIEKAIRAGLFTNAFLVVWVNLGFWQNWWISGLWIIIGLTISVFDGRRETNETVPCQ